MPRYKILILRNKTQNTNGVADFNTIGNDLRERGILDNQYDAIHVMALQLVGWQGGAKWYMLRIVLTFSI